MSDPKRYELYVDASLQAEEGGEWVKWEDYARLKAEVERLTKAGDVMAEDLKACYRAEGYDPGDSETLLKWNAAKEGKSQP
jgi:hypothetical protein